MAFTHPSKPIGSFYDDAQIDAIRHDHPDWELIKDAGRGYRRVVPSPKPKRIVERRAIETLLQNDFTVIAVGGGGIPVIRKEDGSIQGVNAVIDKDHATSLLASQLEADLFIISTAVDYVYINYNEENQEALKILDLKMIEELKAQGQFAPGSMLPKIEAAAHYIEKGGKEAIITSPSVLRDAVRGDVGTHIR